MSFCKWFHLPNPSFIATVNEEEPKFDCTMMELQENDTLSVPAEYLNENEHQMQFVSFICYIYNRVSKTSLLW